MDHLQHGQREMDPQAALAHADRLGRRVTDRSRWYGRFLAVFGVAVMVITPLWGLLTGGTAAVVLNIAWVVFIIVISGYARRQPVAGRGMGRRYVLVIGAWAAIYAVVLGCGFALFPHNPAWWIPSGVAAAAPFYLGAYREHRR
jgi:drug/metabolite transporter (DMT)-like permease